MGKSYVEILDLLQIPYRLGTVFISAVDTQFNTRVVTLTCLCQADSSEIGILRTVEFRECQQVCWEIFNRSPGTDGLPLADIIAIQLGNDQRGKFILFVTDLFELRIAYAEMTVRL